MAPAVPAIEQIQREANRLLGTAPEQKTAVLALAPEPRAPFRPSIPSSSAAPSS